MIQVSSLLNTIIIVVVFFFLYKIVFFCDIKLTKNVNFISLLSKFDFEGFTWKKKWCIYLFCMSLSLVIILFHDNV